MKTRTLLSLLLFVLAQSVVADDLDVIKKTLARIIPNDQPEAISPTPIPGIYEVNYGAQVYYIDRSGKYLFQGDLIDLDRRTSLTEETKSGYRKALMSRLDESSMIVYSPKKKVKHTLTVFTDIDCGYCRTLHQGMQAMNDLGIEVRYLAYPRAGIGSPSYQKIVNVWCAKDRKSAMTRAKAGERLVSEPCNHPIDIHYKLAGELGVSGTPALFLDNGTHFAGYMPPDRLFQALEEDKRQN
ncbi:MAG: DsbC family protein [Gammaproteobacteria bacterium]|nr:DsbC family protein [Gammaproteobacteria bacterium]